MVAVRKDTPRRRSRQRQRLAGTALVGPEGHVAERIAALKESGVTTLNVTPIAASHTDRVALIEKVRDLAG